MPSCVCRKERARHTTLETAATANAGRIEVLRAEIAQLEAETADKNRRTQEADAAEEAALKGLKARVTTEATRLSALVTFFNPSGEE